MFTLGEFLKSLRGDENIELWVDGNRLNNIARTMYSKGNFIDRYVGEIRIDPEIYLGIKIYLRD